MLFLAVNFFVIFSLKKKLLHSNTIKNGDREVIKIETYYIKKIMLSQVKFLLVPLIEHRS